MTSSTPALGVAGEPETPVGRVTKGVRMIVERVNLIKDADALEQIKGTEDYRTRVALSSQAFVELEERGALDILEYLGCEDVIYRGEKRAGVPSADGPPDFTARYRSVTVAVEVTEFFREAVRVRTKDGVRQRSFSRVKEELQSGNLDVVKWRVPDAERALRGVSYYVVTDALDNDPAAEAWDFIMNTIGGSSSEQRSPSIPVDVVFNNHREYEADTVAAELFVAWAGTGYDKTRLRAQLVNLPEEERPAWMYQFRQSLLEAASTRRGASVHDTPVVGVFRVPLSDADEIGVVTIVPTKGGTIGWSDILESPELRDVAQKKEAQMREAESSGMKHDQRWLLLVDHDRESLLTPPSEVRQKRPNERLGWRVERDKSEFPEWCRYWDRVVFFDSVEMEPVEVSARDGDAR